MDQLMARRRSLLLILALLSACSKPAVTSRAPSNDAHLPSTALDQYIAEGIGDPSTCVLLADPATGKVLYRYGEVFNCVRGLPACDRPGDLTATVALKLATPAGRAASCASVPDGSRTVGWTEGVAAGTKRPLIYSAVMEGQRALPGREMAARLGDAFSSAGL
jgi:hypothetical protein